MSGTSAVPRRPPFTFWPLAAFSVFAITLETVATFASGVAPAPDSRARDTLAGLEEAARKTELAIVNLASPEAPDVTELTTVADAAKTLAADENTPPDVREQAAAIWLMYRDLSVLQTPPSLAPTALSPVPGLEQLLPPAQATAPAPPAGDSAASAPAVSAPPGRTALGDVLSSLAAGTMPTRERLDALGEVPMSTWLRSRVTSYLRSPRDAFDSSSQHALAEREWATRLYLVLASIGFPGLAGLVLLVLWPVARRFAPPIPPAPVLPGSDAWWTAWYPVVVWLSVYLGLGYTLAFAGQRLNADPVVLQATVQLVAASLSLSALRWATGAPVLATVRPGLAPFDGRIGRALLWGLVAYAVAIPVVLVFGYLSSFIPVSDPVTREVVQALTNPRSPASSFVLLVSVVALAPVFEEVVFRGVLFRYARLRLGARRAAIVSAGIFALVHANPANALPLFGLGIVLAGVVERSGGLLPAIVVHALWNASQIALMSVTAG